MIRKAQEITTENVEKARGGVGYMLSRALIQGEEFYGKGRMFNHVVLEPGSSVGVHTHVDEMEAYYFLKGEGMYNDNGKLVKIVAGDVTFCADGEKHGIENTGSEDLEFIALILFTK